MNELGRVPLRALVELARLGTMTAVAAELGYTPGAISQQIARLESTVGVPLLHRVGRGVRLTDAGRVLADHGAAVLTAEDTALQAMHAALTSITGRLTIGMFGSTAGAVLAPLVIHLRERHPDIDIRSEEVTVDDSAAAVRRGQVDVAFGVDYSTAPIPRDAEVEFVRLRTERFSLACTSAFADAGTIALEDAAPLPWILTPAGTQFGTAIRNACRTAGFEPAVVHQVTDTASSLALAEAGLGITPVTPLMQRHANSTGRTVALVEDVRRSIVLIRHAADRHRPVVGAVTAAARDVLRENHSDLQ